LKNTYFDVPIIHYNNTLLT